MKKISATVRIVISLVCLSVSSLLIAGTIGLLPDAKVEVMKGRLRLCETLAQSFALAANQTNIQTMENYFCSVAERNPEVESIGLRRSDGSILLEVGEHSAQWLPIDSLESTPTQVVVPVNAGDEVWGAIEVKFQAPTGPSLLGISIPREIALPLFMAVSLFGSYYFYLRKVLRQLNPSKVIPARVREAFDSLAEGILVLDAKEQVVLANHAFERATGRTTEEMMGRSVNELPFVQRENPEAEAGLMPWQESKSNQSLVRGKLLGIAGHETTFSVSSSPIINEKGEARGVLASFEDVTQLEKKKNELGELVKHLHHSSAEIQRQNRTLEQLANHDPLTGCRNRRSFYDQLQTLWMSAMRYEMPIAAIMVDIDHFKSINDKFGHSVGDDVLQTVAKALQVPLREADVLCRYGGEEFAVVLPNSDIEQAAVVAERLRSEIAHLQMPNLKVTASLGVSAISESPSDAQEMLDQADRCLFVAKRQGRNQVVRWDRVPLELHEELNNPAEASSFGAATRHGPEGTKPAKESIPYHAVSALLSALAYRDQKTAAHSRRVADLCVAAAEGLLSLSDSYTLEMAALLHDIGKIGVPDAILLKPGKLTEEEWEVMRSNTRIGSEIVRSSFASKALTDLVNGYQMRFDDALSIYENGKCTIPVGARILAIADAYDSMTTENRYRHGMSHSEAAIELRKNAGTQFDPELVERFLGIVDGRARHEYLFDSQLSSDVALSIGAQIEGLVAALDSQNLKDMTLLAGRLKSTASSLSATEIAFKASELESALHDKDDFVGAMQTASELLDLCRSTQGALLRRSSGVREESFATLAS